MSFIAIDIGTFTPGEPEHLKKELLFGARGRDEACENTDPPKDHRRYFSNH